MSQTQNPIQTHREILQRKFESIEGVRKVYFQPPSVEKIKYPCIIYNFEGLNKISADNNPYLLSPRFTVTVIDHNVESMIPMYVMGMNDGVTVSMDRFFTSDNLNHWVFSVISTQFLEK